MIEQKIELFFEQKIILNKSDNIKYIINKPKFKKKIFSITENYEGGGESYFTILENNNNHYLYYRGQMALYFCYY